MLRSAYFGADAIDGRERIDTSGTATVRGRELQPPSYPGTAIEMHAKGTVYLLAQVGPDGQPMDAIAEQTNLQVVGRSEGEMRFMRNLLAKAALAASRRWLFDVPTTGELADDPSWLVRVPLVFIRVGDRQPGYGEWRRTPRDRNSARRGPKTMDATMPTQCSPAGSIRSAKG